MKTDEVCSDPVRRVCGPCQSLIGWFPFVSCARLMKSDDIVNQLFSQCVASAVRRWLLIGFAVLLSSRVWVLACHLAFVHLHWRLPSPLMVVSSLLVSRCCSHQLVESLRISWVVGAKTLLVLCKGSSSSYLERWCKSTCQWISSEILVDDYIICWILLLIQFLVMNITAKSDQRESALKNKF